MYIMLDVHRFDHQQFFCYFYMLVSLKQVTHEQI